MKSRAGEISPFPFNCFTLFLQFTVVSAKKWNRPFLHRQSAIDYVKLNWLRKSEHEGAFPKKSTGIGSICLGWVEKPNCRETQKLQQTQGSIQCSAVAKGWLGSAQLWPSWLHRGLGFAKLGNALLKWTMSGASAGVRSRYICNT